MQVPAPWAQPAPDAHVTRAAAYMLWAEIENGTQCPATMTYGAVPALARQGGDFADWLPKLLSREYDERQLPIAQKRGALPTDFVRYRTGTDAGGLHSPR